MPKICYVPCNFRESSLAIIAQANRIIEAYSAQGLDLTLRQLYYRFVAANIIKNRDSEYDRLGSILNDARLAGLVDWNAIVDRTRNLRELSHWTSPDSIVEACAESYRVDWWVGQPLRVEVWIEKDALVGVIAGVCEDYDVPYFSCRGYTSQSELWGAAMRAVNRRARQKQRTIVLHFGDHDPSGLDMTRDIQDRMNLFTEHHNAGRCVEVRRMALNMDQIEQYEPPPNPAKMSDGRAKKYVDEYGYDSWELDALEPSVIAALVRDELDRIIDEERFEERKALQQEGRDQLQKVSDRWSDVVEYVE